MSPRPFARAVQHIRRLVRRPRPDHAGDRQLLAAFARRRDEAAFAELVRRHGSLVRGICRRVLGADPAADDAFQATFLLLARKAGAPGWGDSVAGWLHATAWHVARKARRAADRRRRHEAHIPRPAADDDPATAAAWRELCGVLDEELARLPERLRAPLALCYLEGHTRDEAAARLGWSLGTLKLRLERGRALLRDRLTRRGVTLAVAGLPAALAEPPVSAATAVATAEAAVAFVSGDAVSAAVGALIESTGWAFGGKASVVLSVLLAAAALAVGTARLAGPAAPQAPPAPKAVPPAAPVARRDQFNDPLPPGAVARFGTVALRHGNDIMGVQFTPDGRRLVSWAWDGVRVWDAGSGSQVRHFAELPRTTPWQMHAAALSPDGATMAVTYSNAREEQIADGRRRHGGSVEIWDVANGQMRHWFDSPQYSYPVFTPDGKTLALRTVGLNEEKDLSPIVLCDVATGRELRRLDSHSGQISGAVFASGGKELISCGEDGTIRVWDVANGREVRQFAKPPVSVGEPIVSPDGRWLATIDRPIKRSEGYSIGPGSKPNELSPIRLWDVASGHEVRQLAGHNGGSLHLAFTPDSRQLFSGALDRVVRVWDVTTGRELRTLPQAWCRGLALSPDGRTLAVAGLRSLRLRDATTGDDRVTVAAPELGPGNIALSPDGRTAATNIGGEATVNLWETGTGKLLRRLEGRGSFFLGLSWAADGKTILTATMDEKRPSHDVQLWDVATGRELARPAGFDKPFVAFLPSLDGRRIVTFTNGQEAVVWDRATGRSVSELSLEGFPLAITADGQKLFSIDEKVAHVWNLTTGQRVNRFAIDLTERIQGATASPDGRWLVVGDWEKSLMLYEVASEREVRRMEGFTGQVGQLAFSPDSRWLAAGDSRHGAVSVWDAATGRKRHEFVGHRGGVHNLAFTPDGWWLVSGSGDTTALVWDVSDPRSDEP